MTFQLELRVKRLCSVSTDYVCLFEVADKIFSLYSSLRMMVWNRPYININ